MFLCRLPSSNPPKLRPIRPDFVASFGHSTVPATPISALAVLIGVPQRILTRASSLRSTLLFEEGLELESDIESRRFSAGEPIRDELGR